MEFFSSFLGDTRSYGDEWNVRNNVKAFVELASQVLDPPAPVVEIGALQTRGQEDYADLRPLFAGKEYLGCDAVSGPGVDRIENVHRLSFADNSVGTIVCADTLEHVAYPSRAVREMHRVLQRDGVLILCTPFNFPIHHMPDYARFTPEGISHLLAVFCAQAVLFHGDAQNPHTVHAVATKDGDETRHLAFEAAAARLQNRWSLDGVFDPLIRYVPLVSVVRCDVPERRLTGRRIEQRFNCARDGLTRIDVKLGMAGAARSGGLRMRLQDDEGNELTRVELYAPSGYERWVAFQFPTMASPGSRAAWLCLDAPDGDSQLITFVSAEGLVADGKLRVDGRAESGTLCFEVFCERKAEAVDEERAGDADAEYNSEPGAGPSSAIVGARLQAAELHYVSSRLSATLEQLRRDIVGRLDHLGSELTKVQVRREAQAEQLLKVELRQQAWHEPTGEVAIGETVRRFARFLRQSWPVRTLFRVYREITSSVRR